MLRHRTESRRQEGEHHGPMRTGSRKTDAVWDSSAFAAFESGLLKSSFGRVRPSLRWVAPPNKGAVDRRWPGLGLDISLSWLFLWGGERSFLIWSESLLSRQMTYSILAKVEVPFSLLRHWLLPPSFLFIKRSSWDPRAPDFIHPQLFLRKTYSLTRPWVPPRMPAIRRRGN